MSEERIRIYAADVGSLPEIPEPRLSELFPEERVQRILKYRMPGDRIRTAWAELLLRLELEHVFGIPRTEIRICRGENGKPFAEFPENGRSENGKAENGNAENGKASAGSGEDRKTSQGRPEISLSHSGSWAAVSIGPVPHGVDVEVPRDGVPLMNLAERWFLPDEAEVIRKAPEEERTRQFLRLWTVKESFLKMTGEGLRKGPQAADALRLMNEGIGAAEAAPELFPDPAGTGRIKAFTMVLPDGAVLSLCGPEGLLPDGMEVVSAETLRGAYGL